MADGVERFSFRELQARTPGLTGSERLDVFGRLPDRLQGDAWTDLADWARDRSDHDFELLCDV